MGSQASSSRATKQTETTPDKSVNKTQSHQKNERENLLFDRFNTLSIKTGRQKEDHFSGRKQIQISEEKSLNKTENRVVNERKNLLPDSFNGLSINNRRQKEDRPSEFVIPLNICNSILHEIKTSSANKPYPSYTNGDNHVLESAYTQDFIKVETKMYNPEILKHGYIIRLGPAYYCVICDKSIVNDKQHLIQHIVYCNTKNLSATKLELLYESMPEKAKACRLELILELESYMDKWYWYSINRFCCLLCRLSFTNKSNFVRHVLRCHFAMGVFDALIFEGCMSCSTLWISQTTQLNGHESHPTHLYLKESKLFYVEALPASARHLFNDIEAVVDELYQLSENILISNTSVLVSYTQNRLKASLEGFLKKILGLLTNRVRVYFYGPRSTGLTFNESNLYIVYELVIGNIIEDVNEDHAKQWYMIPGADNAVKQIYYKETYMVCDIRNIDDADIKKSEILRLFCKRYQPCRRLILFLKKWLSCCYLPGRYKINEEALTWLVIFSLQANSHLPSVALHQAGQSKCQEWKTNSIEPDVIHYLLVEFFTFYMNFDYRHYVISPFVGCKIRKEHFTEINTLPKEMHQYFKEHDTTGSRRGYLNVGNSLCLQDPVDLNCNLTKNVQSVTLKHFREYCKKSVTALLDIET